MDRETHPIEVSTLTILKVLFILLLAWFLFEIRDILLVFLISIIISSAIDPLADFLHKRRVPRALSVLLVYVLFFGFLALVIALLVPPMTQEFKQISESNFYESFISKVGIYKDTLRNSDFGATISNALKNFANNLSGTIFQTTKGVFTGAVSVITVLAVSFYLTV